MIQRSAINEENPQICRTAIVKAIDLTVCQSQDRIIIVFVQIPSYSKLFNR